MKLCQFEDCNSNFMVQTHEAFGGSLRRKLSIKYKLQIDLCFNHHQNQKTGVHHNKELADKIHKWGQKKFMREQNATVEEFIKIFGRSYL